MKISRKTTIIAAAVIVVAGIALAIGHSTKNDHEEVVQSADPADPPLNISIMLDLSDRLRMTGPNDKVPQWEKDTTIIGYIRQMFIDRQVKKKFMSGDMIHVLCYPNPDIPQISELQNSLTVDLTIGEGRKIDGIMRNKKTLIAMPQTWHNTLSSIYNSALTTKKWDGSDVWGFFEKFAKNQCVKQGYRNVLVILTDGYLYHKTTWRNPASGIYTGILSKTIGQQQSIEKINEDLSDLEVLFLEINPTRPADYSKMRSLLIDWCNNMGIEHVEVIHTDLPINNKSGILNFIK